MTKYQEYRWKADLLDKIIQAVTKENIKVETFNLTDGTTIRIDKTSGTAQIEVSKLAAS